MLILSALVRKYAEGNFYRLNFPEKQAKMEESESESEETGESEDSESSEESDSSDFQGNNLKVTFHRIHENGVEVMKENLEAKNERLQKAVEVIFLDLLHRSYKNPYIKLSSFCIIY